MKSMVDVGRMHNHRRSRLRSFMRDNEIDVLFLLGFSNQSYAGVNQPLGDAGRLHSEPVVVALTAEPDPATVWTNFPEGVSSFGHDIIHPSLPLETLAGLDVLREFLGSATPGARRVAIDELTGVMVDNYSDLFGGVEVVDAGAVTVPARIVKNQDEILCIRTAQRLSEIAAQRSQQLMQPGRRLHELSSRFYKEAHDLGAPVFIEPMWSVVRPAGPGQPNITDGPGYPSPPSNRIVREGDLVITDGGVTWHGYHSDWGKTFVCGNPPTVTDERRSLFEEWSRVLEMVCSAIKPGATGDDLVRAADSVSDQYTLPNLYLGHGIGLDATEPPFIGSDLGPAYDESVVLEPGTVLVLEPVIVREGVGAYRSEEVIVVTDGGYEQLSGLDHLPFGD